MIPGPVEQKKLPGRRSHLAIYLRDLAFRRLGDPTLCGLRMGKLSPPMQPTHLLCYVRRDRLTSWKLDSLDRGSKNNPVLAYGSDHPMFARFAQAGNVIWVVGAYVDGPPTLEAKIEIAGQINRG